MGIIKAICTVFILFYGVFLTAQSNLSSLPFSWRGNDHFKFVENNDQVNVNMKKRAWESFSLLVHQQDISENPVLIFQVKSDTPIELRVDVLDQNNVNKTIRPIVQPLQVTSDFTTVKFDFSEMKENIDLKNIHQFQFFINPGKTHQGNLWIKNIQVGEAKNLPKKNQVQVKLFPNPVTEFIFIKSHLPFNEYRISDGSGKLIFSKSIAPTKENKINVAHLPKGFFFLELLHDHKNLHTSSFTR